MRVEAALTATVDAPSRPGPRTVAVVIDVLRATTSLTVALAAGATRVMAVATPDDGLRLRERFPDALLCGEREGLRIPGFDLGNSPSEYSAQRVAGRPLIFASTNGSIALLAAAGAKSCWLATFVNLAAVVEALAGEDDVFVMASGKLGSFALEDAACAGLLCRRLAQRGATLHGGAARMAVALAPDGAGEVRSLVQGSAHGRYLRSLGPDFARDVEFCSGLDWLGQAFQV